MDLLRQILARLPLQRIFDLSLSDRSFFNVRLRVVNRISEDYLDGLIGMAINTFNAYFILCTAQGELCDRFLLPRELHCARATFLRQKLCISPAPNLDLILATEDLGVIIPTLESSRNPYGIIDLQSVNWRPDSLRSKSEDCQSESRSETKNDGRQIIAFYQRKILGTPAKLLNRSAIGLAGYLHIPLRDKKADMWISQIYARMYVLSEMKRHPDPFAPIPDLDQFLKDLQINLDKRVDIAISSGYFGFNIGAIDIGILKRYAIRYVQPRLLDYLPFDDLSIGVGVLLSTTHHLVERAREMIVLIKRRHPRSVGYLIQLQVICGQDIDFSVLDSLGDMDRDSIAISMIGVAHPQLTAKMLGGIVGASGPTVIRYNLVNYFKQRQLLALKGRTEHELFLCAYGQLLQCFRVDQMKELVAKLKEFAAPNIV